ncbi:hypothetical protein C8Q76DRAFT_796649 [Earliella scabrosa]|nr:hypothetical protein C8Q76DRAFT_796649 [Earliella scabrosa]
MHRYGPHFSGCHVPRVDAFTDKAQLHGGLICDLRTLHKCTIHVDENNAPGACYKPAGRDVNAHVRLNNRRLKSWASALAAGEATKLHPPNNRDFDGLLGPTPRGTSGPHAVPPATTTGTDLTQAILIGLLPVLSGLAGQQLASAHAANVSSMSTSSRLQDDVYSSPPMSLSSSDDELHQFLVALLAKKHVDLLDSEEKLAADDYTPPGHHHHRS